MLIGLPDFSCFKIFTFQCFKFNNAFTSTLAALDSNLVANLGLRNYSPSSICTSAACNNRLS